MNIIRDQRGMALVAVLIIASILTILGTTIWYYSTRDVMEADRTGKKMQAYYLARSGADAVAQYIMTNPDNIDMAKYVESLINSPESDPVKLDGVPGSFKVKVTKDEDKSLVIISTGIVDNVKDSARLTLNRANVTPSLDVALFTATSINMGQKGSAKIIGDVATNAEEPNSVYFPWSAYIKGNLSIGPNGDIDKVISGARPNPKDNVEGMIQNLNATRTYELPKFPEIPTSLPFRGIVEAGWNPSPPYPISNDGAYSDIIVYSELIIHIGEQDRTIVVDNLTISGSGKITLNRTGNGKLYLYVKNKLDIQDAGRVNVTGQPNDVILYYKGSDTVHVGGDTKFVGCAYLEKADIKIGNSGGITGHIITGGKYVEISGAANAYVKAIYAPNAHVKMTGSGNLKGALVCDTFEADGSATLTYDGSVMDTFPDMMEGGDSVGTTYYKGLWR